MTNKNDEINNLYKGLKALTDNSFPKKCSLCGRIYNTVEEYIKECVPTSSGSSGIKEIYDDEEEDKPIIEVYRNCVCGSTLMDYFSDRRDFSEKGLKRRETFSKILGLLEKKGLSHEEGRLELLKVMRGGHSKILEDLEIKSRTR